MHIHQLEMVQGWAARFIKPDYSYDSSVSQMLKDLDLSSLENRRKMNKLTLLYKIRNNLICIKENGYLERADSRTRDASRNYKLKSQSCQVEHVKFLESLIIQTGYLSSSHGGATERSKFRKWCHLPY